MSEQDFIFQGYEGFYAASGCLSVKPAIKNLQNFISQAFNREALNAASVSTVVIFCFKLCFKCS